MCTGPRPFIPVAGVIKCQMIYTWGGQRVENVFNVRSGAGLAVADLDRVQAKLLAWHAANLRQHQVAGCILGLFVLDALDTSSGTHKEYVVSVTGTNGSQSAPTNVTAVVKWTTGLRGRSFRGRTFHVGMGVNMFNTPVSLNPVNQGLMNTSYANLLTALAGGGTADKLVVVSLCANGVWRAAGVATDVSAGNVDVNLDSQRRRLAGRGL